MLLACGLSWLCALVEWSVLEDSILEESILEESILVDSSLEDSREDLAVVRGLEDPTGRPLPRLLIGLTCSQKASEHSI